MEILDVRKISSYIFVEYNYKGEKYFMNYEIDNIDDYDDNYKPNKEMANKEFREELLKKINQKSMCEKLYKKSYLSDN